MQHEWHATANLDWWEVDLGQDYPITKVARLFYRIAKAALTLSCFRSYFTTAPIAAKKDRKTPL
jgi:hypothetical protein